MTILEDFSGSVACDYQAVCTKCLLSRDTSVYGVILTVMFSFLRFSVFAEMMPTVLYARIDSTNELICSIFYRGYSWSSINILQQNTTGSVLLLNASSDGKVESKNARINGSMIRNNDYINVTVSFDMSPGSGVCELNQTYSCEIQLMDSSIGTTAANSTLVIESMYTLSWPIDLMTFVDIHC